MRCTVLLIALAFILSSGSLAAPQGFDYTRQIGVVAVQRNGRPCLAIRAPDITVGTKLTLVWVPVAGTSWPSQILAARVTGRQSQLCDIPEGAEFGDSSYGIAVTGGPLKEGSPYFAVLSSTARLARRGASVQGDLDHDGTPEVFRLCTSSEGLHLTVWSGDPLKGIRRWHRYYYLGYDVEPTCEEPDYKEP